MNFIETQFPDVQMDFLSVTVIGYFINLLLINISIATHCVHLDISEVNCG